MSSSGVALTAIFAIIAVGAGIGFLAGAHRKMDLEQWTVGGRGFGVVLVYLLMAGERSEEHTSELQSLAYLVCRLLLEKKNIWILGNDVMRCAQLLED